MMHHIGDHDNVPAEMLVDTFVTFHGANAKGTDCGGVSRQSLDTFSRTMCHNFLSKHNDLFCEVALV